MKTYLIWSEEHGKWWGPNHRGYTNQIRNAGVYSFNDAKYICGNANYGGTFNEMAIELTEDMELILKGVSRGN